jgi:hypothetical protein
MVLVSEDGGGTVEPVQMLSARIATVSKESAQIQSSAKSFAAAAGKGFHIDPEAAATLINSCRDALDQLTDAARHLDTVSEAPQLGQTPGAQVISPFTQGAAVDVNGIRPAITNLQKTLQDMIQAYKKASTNYAQTEELVQQSMRQQKSTLA